LTVLSRRPFYKPALADTKGDKGISLHFCFTKMLIVFFNDLAS